MCVLMLLHLRFARRLADLRTRACKKWAVLPILPRRRGVRRALGFLPPLLIDVPLR